MLKVEVKRHSQDEDYFEPWIEKLEDGDAWRFHFHWDDISDEGAAIFCEVYTQQSRRWHPLPEDAPRARRIPITMERRAVMPDGEAIVVEDRPDYIAYTVRADLISERGAQFMARRQADLTPHWYRVPMPGRRRYQLRPV